MDQIIDLAEAGNILDVSTASVRNWVRLGLLSPVTPFPESGGSARKLLFFKTDIIALKSDIESGRLDKLKKRRNKKYAGGRTFYRGYIESSAVNGQLVQHLCDAFGRQILTDAQMRRILAGFANSLYRKTRDGKTEADADVRFKKLLCDLCPDFDEHCPENEKFGEVFASVQFVPWEDFLGFTYLSLKSISGRKAAGAYYTPAPAADRLIENIRVSGGTEKVPEDSKMRTDGPILDPCCGSGGILLALMRQGKDFFGLYGTDIDELSIQLARINLFLNGVHDLDFLYSHLLAADFIREEPELPKVLHSCGLILGNPPWKNFSSPQDKKWLAAHFTSASSQQAEAFDIFTEKALSLTRDGGMTAFVLPEAALNVRSHEKLRTVIRLCGAPVFADYIGNPFPGIQCPSVLLGIRRGKDHSLQGCRVRCKGRSYVLTADRVQEQERWCLTADDQEYDIIRHLDQTGDGFLLKDHADFALGIVTGINGKAVSDAEEESKGYHEKSAALGITDPDSEDRAAGRRVRVLRGRDLRKFTCRPASRYLLYDPKRLQQTAPEKFYRAPEKLIYRFVGKVPVFSYDNAQMFTLNSANIVIPHLPGLDIKYVLAILNSRTFSFWWQKKYDALKMLRSHIESVLIPVPGPGVQEQVIVLTDQLIKNPAGKASEPAPAHADFSAKRRVLYDSLENIIMDLYDLDEREKKIILTATAGDERFL